MSLRLSRRPKVELHLHLEGCLTAPEALALARRNGLPWSPQTVASHYRHADFGEFLRHFGALLDLFRTPEDLCWLLSRVQKRLRRQGVVYAEVRLSPSVWERHGMEPVSTLRTLLEFGARGPVAMSFIVEGVRQWGPPQLGRDLDLACRFRSSGVVAFGLGGDEGAAPAGSLTTLAAECRARRIPVVPHAGEVLGPEEVASALDVFTPVRIGHGIGAARSAEVLLALRERGVHLEVCPTSNRRTGVVGKGERHPLRKLWGSGVALSLSTDDPGLFGATLCGELRWAARSAGWGEAEMGRSQIMAALATFLSAGERDALARRVESGW